LKIIAKGPPEKLKRRSPNKIRWTICTYTDTVIKGGRQEALGARVKGAKRGGNLTTGVAAKHTGNLSWSFYVKESLRKGRKDYMVFETLRSNSYFTYQWV